MRFQILGAHQVESSGGHPIAFLIDGHIALDAGGLGATLSLDQQDLIDSVLITHYHFDHVRDLPFVGLAALDSTPPQQVQVYCSQLVRATLADHLLNNLLWLSFFTGPLPGAPTFVHHLVEAGRTFQIGEYEVLPLDNRHHAVPVLAYQIATPEGRRLFYTGDTGPGINDLWSAVQPDVLITEVTWGDERGDLAPKAGHLTPALLERELVAFRELKGYLPRVVLVHVNQAQQQVVEREIAQVARRLHTRLEIADEGMTIDL